MEDHGASRLEPYFLQCERAHRAAFFPSEHKRTAVAIGEAIEVCHQVGDCVWRDSDTLRVGIATLRVLASVFGGRIINVPPTHRLRARPATSVLWRTSKSDRRKARSSSRLKPLHAETRTSTRNRGAMASDKGAYLRDSEDESLGPVLRSAPLDHARIGRLPDTEDLRCQRQNYQPSEGNRSLSPPTHNRLPNSSKEIDHH